MANTINVNQNNNTVSLQDNNRQVIVTDNKTGTTINVTQPVTSIVTISALGPQGPVGPVGPIPNTGSFVLTSSFNAFTSSYYIDSASFEIQILSNSSSIELLSGSFETTSGSFSTRITDLENFSSSLDATFATEAELNLATASLSASISYLSSSFEIFSGSYNTGSFSGSFEGNLIGTSSYSSNSISASYALQALSASYAVSASYEIIKEVSSSHADFADSASYALTASYLDNYIEPFPYTGSAQITGSLGVTGSLTVTNDITSLNNISVLGTVNSLNTAGILDLSNGFDGTSDVLLGADNGTYNAGWVYLVSGSSNGNYAQMGTGGSNGLGISINDRKGATTSWSSWNHIMIGDNLNDYTISQSYPAAVTINVDNLTFNSGVSRSVALGGTGYVVDTSDTAFMQNARIINAITASSALISGSLDVTGGITGSFTGSFAGNGSEITGVISSSYALTASYLDSYVPPFPFVGDAVITGSLVIEENSTTEALRVTQTGTGDAIRIEDSSNPDSTPTVITADGDILIGTGSATINNNKLYVKEGNAGSITPGTGNTIVVESSTTNYIGMFAPDANLSGIVMGSPSDGFGAFIRWGYTSGELRIGAAQTGHSLSFSVGNKTQTSMRLIPAGIGTSDPTSILEVTGSLIVTDSISSSFSGSFEGDGSGLTGIDTGSWDGQYSGSAYITGSLQISSSTNQQLTLIGSGSDQPIFRVQGSEGELFSITDSLSGSLFAINNISGLPILEVFSDDRIIQGDYAAPMLTTTVKNTVSAVGAFTVYELPTASYDGAFFEYTARSGSNARAGQIMSIWSGSQVNFTETTTTDFGSTTGLAFTMIVTGSNFALTGSVTTADWTIKTIVRSI